MSKVAGGWDTGLLECGADVKICLVSWCCGCCQVAHQRAALESRECSFGDSILVFLCPLCCQVKTRGEVREKYGIEGSALSDCCASYYCMPCAIAQQHRQLQMRGNVPKGCLME
eukprot:TRINITY_DN2797_c0_g1_i2.p2 TRINITY_DN2797_c0_g1~~TRINITY_DN2797_c0_g1_i2.p2  ORF type:complete len:114 (+),score=18.86 TRINITY_DN2797_c0_g1_i2:49-390(+)